MNVSTPLLQQLVGAARWAFFTGLQWVETERSDGENNKLARVLNPIGASTLMAIGQQIGDKEEAEAEGKIERRKKEKTANKQATNRTNEERNWIGNQIG